ncbi:MAG: hypothetical protein ACR2HH_08180 [Chthoniobacterales bacterium]
MKIFSITAGFLLLVNSFTLAETPGFDGLRNVMDQETYAKAGLDKLTGAERAVLDAFLRDYVAGKQKDAATVAAAQAVDRAVKERKVRPPEIIESKIVGDFKGYGPRTFFHLANGETWKPTNDDVVSNSPIANPTVIIFRDMFGYKMFVEGASIIRVKRVQ